MVRSATYKLVALSASLLIFDAFGMTSYDPYDPLQIYSSADPHEFLYTLKKDRMLGIVPELKEQRANFAISFFEQKANKAHDSEEETVMLGDMLGLWNMLALTYDHCPSTTVLTPNLLQAANTAFADTLGTVPATAENPDGELFFGEEIALTYTHVSEVIGPHFGMVSAPLEYRKYGTRFDASILIFDNIGARIQGGFAEVQQSLTHTGETYGFIDRSADDLPTGDLSPISFADVQENLSKVHRVLCDSDKIKAIAEELNLDVSDFRKSGFEDLRASLFWRQAIKFNYDNEGWPKFLLVPFVQLYGTLGVGPKRDPFKQFSVSFGSNGHDSVGFNAGIALDFEDSLEIAAEAGGTFFSSESYTIRLPVHLNQRGILPCTASATVMPGNNWHFIGTFNAKRFIDKLSAYAQIILIAHNKDRIRDVAGAFNRCTDDEKSTSQLMPEVIEQISQWNWRMFDLALNYNIAPNISLGAIYQGPLSRKNAPRTKTLLGSLSITF
jgi:hypothetical protein